MQAPAPSLVFSILPDGRLERLTPDLIPEGLAFDPIEPLGDNPQDTVDYLNARTEGRFTHDEAFQLVARHRARLELRKEPFRDGDYLVFGSVGTHADSPISRDFRVQVAYWKMRFNGQSHKLAEMLATRSFPGVRTDATFNRGRCNGNQFETHPELGDQYRRLADAAGVNTTGKHYCSGLADFPGDPTAWVSDRGDVLRIAREKGYRVSGDVEYDPGEREPMQDVAIAPEIVDNAVENYLDDNPGSRREDVEERLTQLLTGAVDPNPLLVQDPPPDIEF